MGVRSISWQEKFANDKKMINVVKVACALFFWPLLKRGNCWVGGGG